MSRVLLLLLGYVFITFSNAWLVWLDFVPLPPEGFSTAMARNYKTSFGKVRLGVDIFCLAFNIFATLVWKIPLQIREGTIIALFIFNIMINFFIKRIDEFMEVRGQFNINLELIEK